MDPHSAAETASSGERWWEFGAASTMPPFTPQMSSMRSFEASSSCGGVPPYFEFGAASNPQYSFPPQTDASMIPFSPSFSPLELHAALDGDVHAYSRRGSVDDGSAYWMSEHQQCSNMSSPQWSDIPSCPPDLWDAVMMSSFSAPAHMSSYGLASSPTSTSAYSYGVYPHIALRPISPSSDSSSGRLSPLSQFGSSAASSRRSSVDSPLLLPRTKPKPGTGAVKPSPGKCCSHCAATATPLWRRNPATRQPLCNACGLYLQQRHKLRPLALIAADAPDDEEGSSACSFDGDADGRPAGGPECSHCHTHKTSVWRRSKTGAKLCNACGVYARLRGRDRPLELRKNKIKPRCKHAKALK